MDTNNARFEVFMAVKTEFVAFWVVVVDGYQCFRGQYCLHQG